MMKHFNLLKKCMFAFFFCSCLAASATNINFPDPNFKAYLLAGYWDLDGDDEISIEEAGRNWRTYINLDQTQIFSVEGIQHFTGLESFTCKGTAVTAVDLSQNLNLTTVSITNNSQLNSVLFPQTDSLSELTLRDNNLTQIPFHSGNQLESVSISEDHVTSIALPNTTTLKGLAVSGDAFTQLPAVINHPTIELISYTDCPLVTNVTVQNNSALLRYYVRNTSVSTIDANSNTNVIQLILSENPNLLSIDVSALSALEEFSIFASGVSCINLSQNLSLYYFSAPSSLQSACIPTGWTTSNYTTWFVNPNTPPSVTTNCGTGFCSPSEICGNGIDDDQDGCVDEECNAPISLIDTASLVCNNIEMTLLPNTEVNCLDQITVEIIDPTNTIISSNLYTPSKNLPLTLFLDNLNLLPDTEYTIKATSAIYGVVDTRVIHTFLQYTPFILHQSYGENVAGTWYVAGAIATDLQDECIDVITAEFSETDSFDHIVSTQSFTTSSISSSFNFSLTHDFLCDGYVRFTSEKNGTTSNTFTLSAPVDCITTKLQPQHCNSVRTDPYKWSYAYYAVPVTGATKYEYHIEKVNHSVNTIVHEAPNNVLSFNIAPLKSFFSFNTTYNVVIRYQKNGVWSDFGDTCSITTPSYLPGIINPGLCGNVWGNALYAKKYIFVTNYRFHIVNTSTGVSVTTTPRSFNFVTFSMPELAPIFQAGTTYDIKVEYEIDGAFRGYGDVCTFSTPASSSKLNSHELLTETSVYPIPFENILHIDSPIGTQYFLYDVTGKIHLEGILASSNFAINTSSLPSGHYSLKLIQDNTVISKAVMKK